MIDADCWPLRKLKLEQLVNQLNESQCSGCGDIGQLDIPYLYKTIGHENLFQYIHETLENFPNFTKKWVKSPLVIPKRYSTGCVVDLPLLYGGFAIYKTIDFNKITIPKWIHSADIWLNIYAIENNLNFLQWNQFQFNRNINEKYYFFHLAGPKPSDIQVLKYVNEYMTYLGKKK